MGWKTGKPTPLWFPLGALCWLAGIVSCWFTTRIAGSLDCLLAPLACLIACWHPVAGSQPELRLPTAGWLNQPSF